MIPRPIAQALKPLFRAFVRRWNPGDPWERIDVQIPLRNYGALADIDFPEYLRGTDALEANSLGDVQQWLLRESVRDSARDDARDDAALLAFRKLVALGHDADLVIGWRMHDGEYRAGHRWLLVRMDGTEWLLETTERERDRMLLPVARVREAYVPELGIDRRGKRFAFAGYIVGQQILIERRRTNSR